MFFNRKKSNLLSKQIDTMEGAVSLEDREQAYSEKRTILVPIGKGFCECFSNNIWAGSEERNLKVSNGFKKITYYNIKCYNCGKTSDEFEVARDISKKIRVFRLSKRK